MIRILSRIKSEPWAVTREVMDTIMDIAQRENMSPKAVAQKLGRPLENTYDVEYRDGVAILQVQGPLFRYANLFTAISGATSYDLLARDFAKAIDDPRVESILLNIDSPGGEANGVSEFADQIFEARGKKPIVAYVGGMGASAAYWLASAADRIVISDTAILGSIGTVMTVQDTRERDAKNGVKTYEIVSSQSPDKRLDPSSDQGRSKMQQLVDSMSDVFIAKMARNRGTDAETVMKDFGKGGVMVGQAAVDAGLADAVGSFEGVLAQLAAGDSGGLGIRGAAASGDKQEVSSMDPKDKLTAAQVAEQHPEAAAALRAEGETTGKKAGATSERERIQGILGNEAAKDRGELAQHFAFTTDMPVEAVIAALEKAPRASAPAPANPLAQAMANEKNPAVGADTDTTADVKPGDELVNTAKTLGLA